jgi:hypothetical protein
MNSINSDVTQGGIAIEAAATLARVIALNDKKEK